MLGWGGTPAGKDAGMQPHKRAAMYLMHIQYKYVQYVLRTVQYSLYCTDVLAQSCNVSFACLAACEPADLRA